MVKLQWQGDFILAMEKTLTKVEWVYHATIY